MKAHPADPGGSRPRAARRIVVGVDGSPNSVAALRRAVAEARRRDAELDIVHVLRGAADPAAVWDGRDLLAEAISEVCPGGLGVLARQRVEPGLPAEVLLRLSEGAELLVIGARARSESGNLFGGDTVRRCLGYAPCPVDVCAHRHTADAA